MNLLSIPFAIWATIVSEGQGQSTYGDEGEAAEIKALMEEIYGMRKEVSEAQQSLQEIPLCPTTEDSCLYFHGPFGDPMPWPTNETVHFTDVNYTRMGNITEIHMQAGGLLDGFQIKYGTYLAPQRGTQHKISTLHIFLEPGERITKITGHKIKNSPSVNGMPHAFTFFSNKGKTYGPKGLHINEKYHLGEKFSAEGYELLAISGIEHPTKYPFISQVVFIFSTC